MLGDNLYGGQKARDFFIKFEQPYRPLVDADVPFYAALGNHDDPAVQMKYKPFNMDGRRFYTFSKGPAQFFALDSTLHEPAAAGVVREGAVGLEGEVEDRLHAPPDLLVGQEARVRCRAANVHRTAAA